MQAIAMKGKYLNICHVKPALKPFCSVIYRDLMIHFRRTSWGRSNILGKAEQNDSGFGGTEFTIKIHAVQCTSPIANNIA